MSRQFLPYFHSSSLLIGPQGVIPVPDGAALVSVFGPVMEILRNKGVWPERIRVLLRSGAQLSGCNRHHLAALWPSSGVRGNLGYLDRLNDLESRTVALAIRRKREQAA